MSYTKLFISVLAFLIVGVIVNSCGRRKIEQEMQQLIGSKIIMPNDSLVTFSNISKKMLDSCNFKYVVYYDSTICTTCTLKNMYFWEVLRDSVTKLNVDIKFIFIFKPPKEEIGKFLNELEYMREELTALVDTSGCFMKKNKNIPQNISTHAFLLDKSNKVIMVGNAQNNPAIEKLFWKRIRKNE